MPGKDSSQYTSYIPILLLWTAAKVLEELILPSINEILSPAQDQRGFRPRHSTTSALLQLSTDIETGLNQRKPPHHTVCVAIDFSVSHNILISRIAGSSLPSAITRCLLCYKHASCNELQSNKVEHENSRDRRPSRIHVITFTVQLLHS